MGNWADAIASSFNNKQKEADEVSETLATLATELREKGLRVTVDTVDGDIPSWTVSVNHKLAGINMNQIESYQTISHDEYDDVGNPISTTIETLSLKDTLIKWLLDKFQ